MAGRGRVPVFQSRKPLSVYAILLTASGVLAGDDRGSKEIPNFSAATGLVHNGIMAEVFALLSFLIYICGLLCSHLAVFRVATNLRLAVTEHIVTLPLGYVDTFGSGKLRKIIRDSTGATETYLAHQLPDKAAILATPVGLIVLFFVFDWRLGLLSLVPVLL